MGTILLGLLGLLLYGVVRPGVNIVIKDTPPPRSAPTDTGVWFVCGLSEKGPLVPTAIQSMTEYATLFGQRVTYGLLYDALDVFFREGGRKAVIARVVGPNAVLGTLNLLDNAAAISLVVKAKNPGDWANVIKVGVVAGSQGGTFQIKVTDTPGAVLEQSGDLVTQADAVGWAQQSLYVTISLGASSLVPVVVTPAVMTGGTDDRASITDTHWQISLDSLSKDLGPGQVSFPGRTTLAAQLQLLAHAQPHNRVAIVDFPDSGSRAANVASAVALRGANARFASVYAPWAIVPGITPGTIRTVPYSCVEAGIIARNDVQVSANYAAAGERGQAQYAIGLSQAAWSDTDRQALNDAGVNVAISKYGGIRTYGFRTLVNGATDPLWINFANSRLLMEIAAQADPILESFMFDPIDGQGHLFSALDGELTGLLNAFFTDGSLFGATPEEAFRVDVGSSVNTPTTIANREIHAVVAIRESEMGEFIEMDLVKVAVSDSL